MERGRPSARHRGDRHRWPRRTGSLLVVGLLALSISPSKLSAQDEVDAEGDEGAYVGGIVDLTSRYIWRGMALSEGPALQPSAWVGIGGLSAALWANVDLSSRRQQGMSFGLNEVDAVLSYEASVGTLTILPVLQLYHYRLDEGSQTTGEGGVELSWPVGPLRVVTAHYVDVDDDPGSYWGELSLRAHRKLGARALLLGGLQFGWGSATFGRAYFGVPAGGTVMAGANAALRWCVDDGPCLRLHAEVSRLVRRELREVVDDPTLVAVGLSICTGP